VARRARLPRPRHRIRARRGAPARRSSTPTRRRGPRPAIPLDRRRPELHDPQRDRREAAARRARRSRRVGRARSAAGGAGRSRSTPRSIQTALAAAPGRSSSTGPPRTPMRRSAAPATLRIGTAAAGKRPACPESRPERVPDRTGRPPYPHCRDHRPVVTLNAGLPFGVRAAKPCDQTRKAVTLPPPPRSAVPPARSASRRRVLRGRCATVVAAVSWSRRGACGRRRSRPRAGRAAALDGPWHRGAGDRWRRPSGDNGPASGRSSPASSTRS
jgi:hypothetical protein